MRKEREGVFFFLAREREKREENRERKTQQKSQNLRNNRTHVEREDLEVFLPSPGEADEAMALLDVDGDGR